MQLKKNKKHFSSLITKRFLEAMDSILSNRKNGKVTADVFGKNVSMTSSNINRLRNSSGENSVTLEAVARICEVYKISPYWLITGKGEMHINSEILAAYGSLEARVQDIEKALTGIESILKIIKNKSTAKSKK